jgi:hypothetical protein
MVTGRPPFHGETTWETIHQLTTQEPVPLRRLQPSVPADLETICLKCLEKEPCRRYATAEALADDLHRFRNGRPIVARPTPPWERAWKWARRRPAAAAFAALSAVTVLLLIGGGLLEARLVKQELAQRRRWDAVRAAAEDWIQQSQQAASAQDWQCARLHLLQALAHIGDEPDLQDLQARAQGLLDDATRRGTEQEQRQRTRQRQQQFWHWHDEALFHATHFTGWELPTDLKASQTAAQKALALFAVTPHGAPALDGTGLDSREQAALREGCYELLLVLAEA